MSVGAFVVGFLLFDLGILVGWCLRVALVRAQGGVTEPTAKDAGIIARWD